MRIWSLHPHYLDAKGLVALWRETLLAQNVLLGNTKGYKNHPQLLRFKSHSNPLNAISNYLHYVCDEADKRKYNFNRGKINNNKVPISLIKVTSGQIYYEWQHFLKKAEKRDINIFSKLQNMDINIIKPNPLFEITDGDVENWEIL